MENKNYLKIEECKDGYLYYLQESRNFLYGVYNEQDKSFYGIRYKFGQRYIDNEYHWDTGAPFGTAQPQKEICKCPVLIDDEKKLFNWLDKMREKYPEAEEG